MIRQIKRLFVWDAMIVQPGTNNISRDNVAKHITSGQHKAANYLRLK